MNSLKWTYFDPGKDSPSDLSKVVGNYIICLRNCSNLPAQKTLPIFCAFEGYSVIYTGIASKCLLTRDFKQHFIGNNAGKSTLRKSIGVLLGLQRIPRDRNIGSRKTKFSQEDEVLISKWMIENLVLFYKENACYETEEDMLIEKLNPPLNLNKNYNIINLSYRRELKQQRNIPIK